MDQNPTILIQPVDPESTPGGAYAYRVTIITHDGQTVVGHDPDLPGALDLAGILLGQM